MSTALLRRSSHRTARHLRIPVALLLVLGALAAFQLGVRQGAPPRFREGGAFLGTGSSEASPVAGGAASRARTVSVSGTTPPNAAAGTGRGPAGTAQGGARVESGVGVGAAAQAGTGGEAASAAGGAPRAVPVPALGTYTYAVSGQESVTGFGSRQLPATMTVVVHRASGLPADEVVLDIHVSDQHNEREILEYRPDAVVMSFEAGAITFGPMTQTSQADYVPPIAQAPLPATSGATLSGTSQARASDGSVNRVEDWTTTVAGAEAVAEPGGQIVCPIVQLQRRSRPGYPEQETRSVTYWYDLARHIWAKWHVVMHGQRSYVGFTFTYDENLTATLQGFQPA